MASLAMRPNSRTKCTVSARGQRLRKMLRSRPRTGSFLKYYQSTSGILTHHAHERLQSWFKKPIPLSMSEGFLSRLRQQHDALK